MVTNRNRTAVEQAVFRALAEPTRRRLLDALSSGPRSAGSLANRFPTSRPAVARHLRVLREADLVRVQRDGRRRLYALNAVPLAAVDRWVGRYKEFWSARLDELTRFVEGAKEAEEPRRMG